MYSHLHELLSDKTGATVFTCFGLWHLLYMVVIFGTIAAVYFLLRGKSAATKQCSVSFTINLAFVLYIADFFLMPFAYGEIDLEKLPFHMCTAMCVLSFISHHNQHIGALRRSFAVLGLLSNLVYVIYPAGVGWYQIHPLSYRVIQTLLFHGIMTAYGIFTLLYDSKPLCWKDLRRDLAVLVAMTAWAWLGNTLYNGTADGYSHFFNWFFVVRDPFYLLPEDIAPYMMPFVVVLVFFAADLLLYSFYFGIKKLGKCPENK